MKDKEARKEGRRKDPRPNNMKPTQIGLHKCKFTKRGISIQGLHGINCKSTSTLTNNDMALSCLRQVSLSLNSLSLEISPGHVLTLSPYSWKKKKGGRERVRRRWACFGQYQHSSSPPWSIKAITQNITSEKGWKGESEMLEYANYDPAEEEKWVASAVLLYFDPFRLFFVMERVRDARKKGRECEVQLCVWERVREG